jgi:hypothetical protein
MFTITPMTRVEVRVDGEEEPPDTLSIATLIYDLFSVGNDTFDLLNLISQLSKTGECRTHFMPGYGGPAVIKVL